MKLQEIMNSVNFLIIKTSFSKDINFHFDVLKDNIDTVNQLIEAGLKVAVYNGQLDLIVDTPGQELWMKKLKSNNALDLQSQKWTPEYAYLGQDTGGYSKTSNNLSFWWVLKAGHMVPADQGEFMLYLMDTVMNS